MVSSTQKKLSSTQRKNLLNSEQAAKASIFSVLNIMAKRYGFDISLKSTRCVYIPTDRDICPGNIAQCSHCKTVDDCKESGGTTFTVTFPVGKNTGVIDDKK